MNAVPMINDQHTVATDAYQHFVHPACTLIRGNDALCVRTVCLLTSVRLTLQSTSR